MASLAEAATQVIGGAVAATTGNILDRVKQKRDEAFQREGWDRQDQRVEQEQKFSADQAEIERKARSEAADLKYERDKEFRADQAEIERKSRSEAADLKYERDKEIAQIKASGKGKGSAPKLVNTDQGVFATMGNEVYRVTDTGLEKLNIGTGEIPQGDEVELPQEDDDQGFISGLLDKGANWATSLFSKEPSMADAATGQDAKYDEVKTKLEKLRGEGAGFGEVDTLVRNSDLGPGDQIKLLLSSYFGGTGDIGEFAKSRGLGGKEGNKFAGKPYGQAEFDKVRERYPNASEEQVLKSLDEFYSKNQSASDTKQRGFEGFGDKPYSLEDIAEFRRNNPGISFDKAVELLDSYYNKQ